MIKEKPNVDNIAPPAANPSKPSCQLYELIIETIIKTVMTKLKVEDKL